VHVFCQGDRPTGRFKAPQKNRLLFPTIGARSLLYWSGPDPAAPWCRIPGKCLVRLSKNHLRYVTTVGREGHH
jgi:hypothetical protein